LFVIVNEHNNDDDDDDNHYNSNMHISIHHKTVTLEAMQLDPSAATIRCICCQNFHRKSTKKAALQIRR